MLVHNFEELFTPIPEEIVLAVARHSAIDDQIHLPGNLSDNEYQMRYAEEWVKYGGSLDELEDGMPNSYAPFVFRSVPHDMVMNGILRFEEEKNIYRLYIKANAKVEKYFKSRVALLRARCKVASIIIGKTVTSLPVEEFDLLFKSYIMFEFMKNSVLVELLEKEKRLRENPKIPVLTDGNLSKISNSSRY